MANAVSLPMETTTLTKSGTNNSHQTAKLQSSPFHYDATIFHIFLTGKAKQIKNLN